MKTRRVFLKSTLAAVVSGTGLAGLVTPVAAAGGTPRLTVYKNPTCGCCEQWIAYLERAGFEAKVVNMDDLDAIKRMARVPEDLVSCHTAIVGGYTVEGHVPAEAIRELLATRPDVFGIAAPGMPSGSPGMGGPTEAPLEVIAFSADGHRSLFMSF